MDVQIAKNYENFLKETALKDSSELNDLKNINFNNFKKQGLPTKRNEDWKQSSLNDYLKNSENLTIFNDKQLRFRISKIEKFKHNKIVLFNGQLQKCEFEQDDFNKITVLNIEDYFKNNNKNLLKLFTNKKNPLVSLNNSLSCFGIYLEVKESVKFLFPVIIYNNYDEDVNQKQIFQKNYFVINANSNIEILEKYQVKNKNTLININSNIDVLNNSNCKNYILNSDNEDNCVFRFKKVNVQSSGIYESFLFSSKIKTIRDEIEVNLNEKLAECYLYYLQFLKNYENHEIKVRINHFAESCKSYQFSKSIIDDDAKGIYQGKIFVDSVAQKTNGYQLIKSLLLSDHSIFHSKPELEIYADDVKCSHGSSSTSLNKEELFYLMARGITKNNAKKLIISGYLNDLIEKISDEFFKDYFLQKIEEIFA